MALELAIPISEVTYGALVVALFGLVVLCYAIVRIRALGRPDIYRSATDIPALFDDCEDEAPDASSAVSQHKTHSRKGFTTWHGLATAGIVLMTTGGLYGGRNVLFVRHSRLGDTSASSNDFSAAESQYRKATRLEQADRETHMKLAEVLLRQQKYAAAIPELRLASRGEKLDPKPYIRLGGCLLKIKQSEEAEKAFRQAIIVAPRDPMSYVELGRCLGDLKRYEDAMRQFRTAIAIDPKCAKAYNALGLVEAGTGQLEAGRADLAKAAQLEPDSVEIHNSLGIVSANSGKYMDAVKEFRDAIALDPQLPVAYYNLGMTLQKVDDPRGALEALQTYVQLCTDHPGPALMVVADAAKEIARLRPIVARKISSKGKSGSRVH